MRVIVVDNDVSNLEVFEMEKEGKKPIEIVGLFQNPKEALTFAENSEIDLAVLNIEMPEPDKIVLERELQRCCQGITMICNNRMKSCTYNNEMYPKPVKNTATENRQKVYIRTFGRFEIFVDGHPIEFSSSKAKELIALLVDRKGSIVTTEEMLTYLWEDRPNDARSRSYCRKVIQRMHKGLEKYGIDDIIIRHRRGRSLDIEKVECDYYQYLEEDSEMKKQFRGEYMTNYSWAEETLAGLMW